MPYRISLLTVRRCMAWACACNGAGMRDQAQDLFARSITNDPYLAPPRYALARLLIEQGKLDVGIEQLRERRRSTPRTSTHISCLAACSRRGDWAGASQSFGTIVQMRPDHVPALVNLGVTLLNLGQTDRAVGHLETALRYEPDSVQAHFALAKALQLQAAPSRPSRTCGACYCLTRGTLTRTWS